MIRWLCSHCMARRENATLWGLGRSTMRKVLRMWCCWLVGHVGAPSWEVYFLRATRSKTVMFPMETNSFPQCTLWVSQKDSGHKRRKPIRCIQILFGYVDTDKGLTNMYVHAYVHILSWIYTHLYILCTCQIISSYCIVSYHTIPYMQTFAVPGQVKTLSESALGFPAAHRTCTDSKNSIISTLRSQSQNHV